MAEQNNEDEKKDPDVITLKLVRSIRKVVLEDENDQPQNYTLREMTGSDKGKWQTGMARRIRFDGQGRAQGIQDWTGMEAALITKCLYDDAGKRVPEETISSWPTTVQKALFQACRELNGLTEEDEEKEKND